MPTVVEWRLVTDTVLGRLGTVDPADSTIWHGTGDLAGVTIYDGDVPARVPLLDDPSHRVAPYVVLRSSIGNGFDSERGLNDVNVDSQPLYTATCVAGWRADCEQLAATVHGLLFRWAPTLTGHGFGLMRPPAGYQPPILPDRDVSPPRFYVPLQYRLPVHR